MTHFNRLYIQSKLCSKRHKKTGSQIAEFPPALILIFFALLFPFINMLYLVCAYAAGWYLNSIELREVACSVPSAIGLSNAPNASYRSVTLPQTSHWNGLFGVSEDINSPQVAQFPPSGGSANTVGTSQVKTTVNINPLVTMPSLPMIPLGEVPGLGKPLTFVYSSVIQQEEPGP